MFVCWLSPVVWRVFDICGLLVVVCCVLVVVCCLPLLGFACRLSCVVCCLLFVVCRVVCSVLLVCGVKWLVSICFVMCLAFVIC